MSATVASGCPHGEVHRSACLDCVEGEPPPRVKLSATKWLAARYPGPCARDETHHVAEGDQVLYVPALGWCCSQCAKPAQTWSGTGYYIGNVQVIETRTVVQLWCKACGATVERAPAEINATQEAREHGERCTA